jgi:hypothetical protein
MSAVVSFLNESVVESLKGAYKLRKSYQLLHKLFDMIVDVDGTTPPPLESNEGTTEISSPEKSSEEDSDEEFVDAADDISELTPLSNEMDNMNISNGTSESEPIAFPVQTDLIDDRPTSSSTTPNPPSHSPTIDRRVSLATVSSLYDIPTPPQSDLTIADQTIYSGTLMALGTIMLLISLLPPSLSRLLSIIGFRGSRSQALSMLWKISPQESPFGGLATFVLGAYYGNIVQNSDIISDDFSTKRKDGGTTLEKLHVAILKVRKRYPDSALWAVEEVLQLLMSY